MKFLSNSTLFVLGPVFLVATDFIATRTSTKATTIGLKPKIMNLYGTKYYNTNFRLFPRSDK